MRTEKFRRERERLRMTEEELIDKVYQSKVGSLVLLFLILVLGIVIIAMAVDKVETEAANQAVLEKLTEAHQEKALMEFHRGAMAACLKLTKTPAFCVSAVYTMYKFKGNWYDKPVPYFEWPLQEAPLMAPKLAPTPRGDSA